MEEVKDFSVTSKTTIEDLGKKFLSSGGFVSRKIGIGIEILKDISNCNLRILSFPAAIVSTGTRGLLKDLLKNKKFDIVMTTCGTLDHDFARIWKSYYQGSFEDSDSELRKKRTHRLGSVRIPESSYGGIIEEKIQPILKDMHEKGLRDISTYEFIWEIGRRLEKEPRKEESLIYWSWKNQIPMIIPGITDGAFGLQILMFRQDHPDFSVNVWKDEKFLLEKMFGKMKSGALMIGGGISKHHTIWWSQFIGGLDYAVYITTAPEWDGSLSGARIKEGISWGKVKEKARFVTIEGDATEILPLLVGPLL